MTTDELKQFMNWCVENKQHDAYDRYHKEFWRLIRMCRMVKIKRIFKYEKCISRYNESELE